MRWLRGFWYSLVYLWEWGKFSSHYSMVWEAPPVRNIEELRELKRSMAAGPMRYEFKRLEALRERAVSAFYPRSTSR